MGGSQELRHFQNPLRDAFRARRHSRCSWHQEPLKDRTRTRSPRGHCQNQELIRVTGPAQRSSGPKIKPEHLTYATRIRTTQTHRPNEASGHMVRATSPQRYNQSLEPSETQPGALREAGPGALKETRPGALRDTVSTRKAQTRQWHQKPLERGNQCPGKHCQDQEPLHDTARVRCFLDSQSKPGGPQRCLWSL